MLRVAEQSQRTDTGRQRSANEDSLFVRAPLFVVADGMGGAQAGEVASRIAAEAFEPVEIDDRAAPEAFLREIVQGANHQIHRIAQHDASRTGMGTTLTAALLRGDEVTFAHVGDSRAYVLRDGELRLLTSDHSLVEELRRQGRLTDAQAEEHPQRSIITRALGPEPEVDVDTMTYRARPGDVYILCSDGLTTMVKEPRIVEIAAAAASLEELTQELVRAANEAGGRDNITVVAFRVAEAEVSAEPDGATLVGSSAEEAGLTAAAVREGAARGRSAAASAADRTPARSAAPSRRVAAAEPERRSLGRRLGKVLIIALALGIVAAGALYGARQIYFLGTDDGGRLTLYRGLPYDLPLGLELYSEQYAIPIQATSVPQARRDGVTNHELRSRSDAVSLLGDLRMAAEDASAQRAREAAKRRAGEGGGRRPGGSGSGGASGSLGGGGSGKP